jgi:hypothetical protein
MPIENALILSDVNEEDCIAAEPPVIRAKRRFDDLHVRSNIPLTLEILWDGGSHGESHGDSRGCCSRTLEV